MDAVNSTNQIDALRRIQQALKIDPKDTNAILELAAMQRKPDIKRELLSKILLLDPVHKQAREMLLELDRAEMQGGNSQPPASALPSASPRAAAQPLEKPLASRYALIPRIIVYVFLPFSTWLMFLSFGDWDAFIFAAVCFLVFLIPLWFVSAVLRVDSSGIQMSRLFGIYRREADWTQIESIQPAFLGMGLRLKTHDGDSVSISSQMSRYSRLVEIMMKLRPDLFMMAGPAAAGTQAQPASAASFAEPKTFQRASLIKVGALVLGLFSCLVSLVALGTQPLVGILVVAITSVLWVTQLYSPHTVSVQGNRLSAKSMLRQEEWTANQIKNIYMGYTRSRYGHKRRFIRVETLPGRAFRLSGFAGGDEILFGFLRSWWETQRNS